MSEIKYGTIRQDKTSEPLDTKLKLPKFALAIRGVWGQNYW
jgi:hypothetical protein